MPKSNSEQQKKKDLSFELTPMQHHHNMVFNIFLDSLYNVKETDSKDPHLFIGSKIQKYGS